MEKPGGQGDLSRRGVLVAAAAAALGLTGLRVLAARNKYSHRGLPFRRSEGLSVPPQLPRDDYRMRARVTEGCIACGLCRVVCPEVFAMGNEFAVVIVAEVPRQAEQGCRQAARDCPAQAIVIEEG